MESKWDYKLTQIANTDLEGIICYIAFDLANPKAASDFMDKVSDTIENIRTFPKNGTPLSNMYMFRYDIRKKYIGNYTMYYYLDIDERTIYILRIVYAKKNMDVIVKEMEGLINIENKKLK